MILVIPSVLAASTAAEDEQDISKVSCDLHLFEVYVKGFLEGCGGALTDLEVEMLDGCNPDDL